MLLKEREGGGVDDEILKSNPLPYLVSVRTSFHFHLNYSSLKTRLRFADNRFPDSTLDLVLANGLVETRVYEECVVCRNY